MVLRCEVLTVRPHTTVAYSPQKKYIRNKNKTVWRGNCGENNRTLNKFI